MSGNVLQLSKGGICLERLAQSLSSPYPDVVVEEAVRKGSHEASAASRGANSRDGQAAYSSQVNIDVPAVSTLATAGAS